MVISHFILHYTLKLKTAVHSNPIRDRILGGTTLIKRYALLFSYRYRRCYAVFITQNSETGSEYFP